MPGRASGTPCRRRTSAGADGACVARQGARRVGEPLRCGHDGIDRLLFGLLRHARLRHLADARDRLSPTVSSIPRSPGVRIAQIDLRAGQIGRRAKVDLGIVGDVRSNAAGVPPVAQEKKRRRASGASAAPLCESAQATRRARRRLDGQGAHPSAASHQGDQRSGGERTPSSPPTSACRRCGRRAISR